jgi:type I restriction enzyme S subunit
MFKEEILGACFQNTLIRFRAASGISSAYVLLVFRHYLHAKKFQRVARWSTNIAHLGLGRLAEMEVPVPPSAEQERIAAEAERKLTVMGAQEKGVEALGKRCKTLRHSILRRALTGKLVRQRTAEGTGQELLAIIEQLPAPKRDPAEKRRLPNRARIGSLESTMKGKRRPLYEVLVTVGQAMSTADLFVQSGYEHEYVDEFFDELRQEGRVKKRIRQVSASADGSTLEVVR